MCTCEIQHVKEILVRWSPRKQITPLMITAANNKYISTKKAGQMGKLMNFSARSSALIAFLKSISNGREECVSTVLSWGGSEQQELTRDHGCNLPDNLAMPLGYYVNPNISHEATSFAQMRNLFWGRHRCEPCSERGRSRFSSWAGSHPVCWSHFYVSNQLSAPGWSTPKKWSLCLFWKAAQTSKGPWWTSNKTQTPRNPETQVIYTTASPFQSVSGVEFI